MALPLVQPFTNNSPTRSNGEIVNDGFTSTASNQFPSNLQSNMNSIPSNVANLIQMLVPMLTSLSNGSTLLGTTMDSLQNTSSSSAGSVGADIITTTTTSSHLSDNESGDVDNKYEESDEEDELQPKRKRKGVQRRSRGEERHNMGIWSGKSTKRYPTAHIHMNYYPTYEVLRNVLTNNRKRGGNHSRLSACAKDDNNYPTCHHCQTFISGHMSDNEVDKKRGATAPKCVEIMKHETEFYQRKSVCKNGCEICQYAIDHPISTKRL